MTIQPYKLSFITVNYNGLEDTRALLQRINSISFSFLFEVIVIDNGSAQDEFALLKAEFPFITGCYSPVNLGFAGGNNVGIRMSQGDFLYFINNDTLLPMEANTQILAMLAFFEQNPEVGGITPKIKYVEPPEMIQFAGCTPLSKITLRNKQIGYREIDKGQYNRNIQIPYLHGAAMLLPRDVVDQIGLMPEAYFLYYEELDWCYQITKRYQLYYFAEACIYHKESASTGVDSPFKTFYLTRNRLLFAYRNSSGMTRILSLMYLLLIANTSKMCSFMLNGKWKHIHAMWSATRAAFKLFKSN
ncbi:glycosyltransferase family 2 protein [Sphingobacterium anhuiense]|uniref:glycosyltransferase family 2 protein n=1 Tax=Sphingobacterium anhuiense TaxID=493780 RepID=UPI003C2F0EAD